MTQRSRPWAYIITELSFGALMLICAVIVYLGNNGRLSDDWWLPLMLAVFALYDGGRALYRTVKNKRYANSDW